MISRRILLERSSRDRALSNALHRARTVQSEVRRFQLELELGVEGGRSNMKNFVWNCPSRCMGSVVGIIDAVP